jgi:NAD(P)-dependent dehydrogenase (short-subunit alcohol dehydrogenase family)
MGMLAGRVAVVTGGGQGIGQGIARALTREGMHAIVVDRDAAAADDTVAQLAELGTEGISVVGDVSDPTLADRAVGAAVSTFGRLDALVNGAQAMRSGVPFEEHTDADFELAISTGLWGAFRFMRAAFPHLRERGGSIVNIVSSAGTHGLPGFAGYAAAKEGIRGLTKVAANEWGSFEIRVNAISPQATSAAVGAYFDAHPDRREAKLAHRPIKRDGDAEADIGRTVVFLVGPDSRYITGVTLMVNGGLTIMP